MVYDSTKMLKPVPKASAKACSRIQQLCLSCGRGIMVSSLCERRVMCCKCLDVLEPLELDKASADSIARVTQEKDQDEMYSIGTPPASGYPTPWY